MDNLSAADRNDDSIAPGQDTMDAQANDLLVSMQKGKEWDIQITSALTGVELCMVRASPNQALAEVAVLVRLSRRRQKPLLETGVVFVQGGKILHDGLSLKYIVPDTATVDSTEPRVLHALEMSVENTVNTLHRARCDHVLDSLQQYKISVPYNIPDEPFGEILAKEVYDAVMAGGEVTGRVTFDTQKGIVHSSRTENWSLSRQVMEVVRVSTGDVPLQEQIRRFGNVRLAEKVDVAVGRVTLCVAGHPHVWSEESDFVNFWESMSERRLHAYLVAMWYSKQGLLTGNMQAPDRMCWVSGGPNRLQLQEVVQRCARKKGKMTA